MYNIQSIFMISEGSNVQIGLSVPTRRWPKSVTPLYLTQHFMFPSVLVTWIGRVGDPGKSWNDLCTMSQPIVRTQGCLHIVQYRMIDHFIVCTKHTINQIISADTMTHHAPHQCQSNTCWRTPTYTWPSLLTASPPYVTHSFDAAWVAARQHES